MAVYDFGGGTFDISILKTDGKLSRCCPLQVMSGWRDDLDFLCGSSHHQRNQQQYEISLENDLGWQRIREASEIAKRETVSVQNVNSTSLLSRKTKAAPFIYALRNPQELEKLIESTVEGTLTSANTA